MLFRKEQIALHKVSRIMVCTKESSLECFHYSWQAKQTSHDIIFLELYGCFGCGPIPSDFFPFQIIGGQCTWARSGVCITRRKCLGKHSVWIRTVMWTSEKIKWVSITPLITLSYTQRSFDGNACKTKYDFTTFFCISSRYFNLFYD